MIVDAKRCFVLLLAFTMILLALDSDAKIEEEPFTTLEAQSSPLYIKPIAYKTIMEYEAYETSENTERIADAIILCESNNSMVYGDNGRAYGVAQFWKGTFQMMKDASGMYWLDYYSANDQRNLLMWAIDNNLISHWTCAYTLGYVIK